VSRRNVKIYVEGGGDQNKLRRECRRAFSKFFEKAGFKGKMPGIVACGGRQKAYNDFRTAVRRASSEEMPFLLVDSEAAVSVSHKDRPWNHLKQRDRWDKPDNSTDEQAHLMVQVMESWFLADPSVLRDFFGNDFRQNALPGNKNIEQIPKEEVLRSLKKASGRTGKGEYGKGPHSFKILEKINPESVAASSGWARRLLDELKTALS